MLVTGSRAGGRAGMAQGGGTEAGPHAALWSSVCGEADQVEPESYLASFLLCCLTAPPARNFPNSPSDMGLSSAPPITVVLLFRGPSPLCQDVLNRN